MVVCQEKCVSAYEGFFWFFEHHLPKSLQQDFIRVSVGGCVHLGIVALESIKKKLELQALRQVLVWLIIKEACILRTYFREWM